MPYSLVMAWNIPQQGFHVYLQTLWGLLYFSWGSIDRQLTLPHYLINIFPSRLIAHLYDQQIAADSEDSLRHFHLSQTKLWAWFDSSLREGLVRVRCIAVICGKGRLERWVAAASPSTEKFTLRSGEVHFYWIIVYWFRGWMHYFHIIGYEDVLTCSTENDYFWHYI